MPLFENATGIDLRHAQLADINGGQYSYYTNIYVTEERMGAILKPAMGGHDVLTILQPGVYTIRSFKNHKRAIVKNLNVLIGTDDDEGG